ncbi:unnamed protein product [Ceutorhynchus assimilis]|uniref:Uncharacterized protein n=1 Tax=Ceutorhynchus assimilis TaxID=467358 RepID=A0A9N9N2Z4_9CUCU|nr:unnamed protein product [Ceutorhynchus assimilis]
MCVLSRKKIIVKITFLPYSVCEIFTHPGKNKDV